LARLTDGASDFEARYEQFMRQFPGLNAGQGTGQPAKRGAEMPDYRSPAHLDRCGKDTERRA